MFFEKKKYKDGKLSKIFTSHGIIQTPAFTFCATKGTIKGQFSWEMEENKTQILLVNTFHMFEKSLDVFNFGGIHKFMNWNGPIISDSGGYQVFSFGYGSVSSEIKGVRDRKSSLVSIKEEGCSFKNQINGNKMFINAELSMQKQIELGVDIAVAFDECTPYSVDYEYTKKSLYRSHRWEDRSLNYFSEHKQSHQKLYAVLQGGIYEDLRLEALDFVLSRNFDGIAIGGSLGKTKEQMHSIVKFCAEKILDKPIHLLGIGDMDDLIELAPYIETFDCVQPTRLGRHGIALRPKKRLNLHNAFVRNMSGPIDETCECKICKNYSAGYLAYLLQQSEMTGIMGIIYHNVFTMNRLMENIRNGIKNDELWKVKNFWI